MVKLWLIYAIVILLSVQLALAEPLDISGSVTLPQSVKPVAVMVLPDKEPVQDVANPAQPATETKEKVVKAAVKTPASSPKTLKELMRGQPKGQVVKLAPAAKPAHTPEKNIVIGDKVVDPLVEDELEAAVYGGDGHIADPMAGLPPLPEPAAAESVPSTRQPREHFKTLSSASRHLVLSEKTVNTLIATSNAPPKKPGSRLTLSGQISEKAPKYGIIVVRGLD